MVVAERIFGSLPGIISRKGRPFIVEPYQDTSPGKALGSITKIFLYLFCVLKERKLFN